MAGARRDATFTVDVEGDWAGTGTRGIREALPRLIALLDRHGATATFFVVGDVVDLVRAIVDPDGPHEVGSHGLTHADLTRLRPRQVRHEVEESKLRLEAAGYTVEGFRAPYFARPAGLGRLLAGAGYRYDASVGALHPLRRALVPVPGPNEPLPVVALGSLRDGRTPFGLTYLRLAHPWGLRLVGDDPGSFYCHPHELVGGSPGWTALPWGLRQLHCRNSGAPAWTILERLLARPDLRFVSCRRHLALAG
jgi:peptidoglycan/xylan/chitin deacetylase (PgdA/CDA1 family)